MTDKTRRNLAKSLIASGGSVALGKSLPKGWITPIVENVVLPAHAQTSFLYNITCTVEDTDGPCGPTIGNEFRVFGSVSGGNLQGVVLKIEYINELNSGDCTNTGFAYETTTQVQAGNVFDETVLPVPPFDEWCDPEGIVRVRFQDQATYGGAECSGTHDCLEVGETP